MNYSGNNNSTVFLKKLEEIVIQNLGNEQFGVSDLADNIGISRSQLHRKVKKLCNKSISRFIRDIKLNKALELLKDDTLTVSEVAYNVGFSNPSYFNNCFHERYGISPGEFKGKEISEVKMLDKTSPELLQKRKVLIVLALFLTIIIAFAISYFVLNNSIPGKEQSIAVLPFDNLSSNSENQYFADGVVEDLLIRFSKIDGLKVISRTSSEMFREKGNKTIPEIGKLLGVTYILEGSIQREVDKIRINVQLIDAHSDKHIFSCSYEKDLEEVFKLQSELAWQITNELSIYLTSKEKAELERNQTENLKAFDYYQQGRHLLDDRINIDILNSLKYFQRAIKEDPNYALAYAGLASAYFNMTFHNLIEKKVGRDTAIKLALKAMELDNNLCEAHSVLGLILVNYDFNFVEAEKEYLEAIRINPNSAATYHKYAGLLYTTGRKEQAREYINKAIELDPLSFSIRNSSSDFYCNAAQFNAALAENIECHKLIKDHPWVVGRDFSIYIGLGDNEAALESFKKVGVLYKEFNPDVADSAYNASGVEGLLRLRIKTWDWSVGRAAYYALLGEDEKAIEQLNLAMREDKLRPYYITHYSFKKFESNPEFIDIKKRLGLMTYPK